VRRSDGTMSWMMGSAFPVLDPNSGALQGVVLTMIDITKRKQAEEELEELSYKYRNLLESIVDGFFALDHFGRFTYINPSAEHLIGRSRMELLGNEIWKEFPQAIGTPFHELYVKVMADRLPVVIETYYAPLKRWFKTRAYPSQDGISVLFEDITERHAREITVVSNILQALNAQMSIAAAFHDVAAGLRTLTGCDRSSVAVFDEDYEWATVVGLDAPRPDVQLGTQVPLSDIPGTADLLQHRPYSVSDLAKELDSPVVQRIYADGFRSILCLPLSRPQRVLGMLTLTWRSVDGNTAMHSPLLDQVAEAVAMAVEKDRLFEQVRHGRVQLEALSHRLLEIQETERRHIARELHDEIGQGLTGLKLVLDTVQRLPADRSRTGLADAHRLVNDLLTRVRNLSLDLRPGMLDDLGLLPALLWLFKRYSSQTSVHVAFEHSGLDRRFAPEIETAAYRILQEALTNVARHAGVAEVTVRVWADHAALTAEVIDHGSGFSPERALTGGNTGGLTGMRERALLLGGRLTLESAANQGTRVIAELPASGTVGGDKHVHQHSAR